MKKIYLLFVLLLFFNCRKNENEVNTSFYYWKTQFLLDKEDQDFLKNNQIEKMYVRYFDVGLKGGNPVPISAITFDSIPKNIEIIPVVYIKNDVVLKPNLNVNELATQMVNYISQINKANNITIKEIQLDCDWSLNSKNQFFALVDEIKKQTNLKMSATIRLHQVKYFEKTGVPNVDEGVLMYYNMGVISADSLNSIYDREVALKYITTLNKYPLKLNIALPVYSWVIHTRNKKPINLISRIRAEQLDTISNFKKIDANRYLVLESTSRFGTFFKKNDLLKIENTTSNQVQEMISDLSKNMNEKPNEIIFYDFDKTNTNYYENEFFKKMSRSF